MNATDAAPESGPKTNSDWFTEISKQPAGKAEWWDAEWFRTWLSLAGN